MSSLASLLSQAHLDDHDHLLAQANAALKKDAYDLEAQHVRLVAYIKLDRYLDADIALGHGGDALRQRAPLEAAYTLYKRGKLEEARQLAADAAEQRGLVHVAAQAAYRAEDFEQARKGYEQLAQLGAGDDENDLRINSWAIEAQLDWAGKHASVQQKSPERRDLDQFEVVFNVASGYAARGELKQAGILLQRARDLCAATDLEDAEKKSELSNITVQQIYVLLRQGKLQEAEQLCGQLDVLAVSDPVTRLIAQSNILNASSASTNPYLDHRLYQTHAQLPRTNLPFSYQSAVLKNNSHTLDLSTQKFSGVARSTLATLKQHADKPASREAVIAGTFNAAAHTHCSTSKSAVKALTSLQVSRPNDVGLLITIIQAHLANHNSGAALAAVEGFLQRLDSESSESTLRYAPGLVAVAAALYLSQNRQASAKAELAKAATHWQSQGKDDTNLLCAAGAALVSDASEEDLMAAQNFFQAIRSLEPGNGTAASGVVAASTATNPAPKDLVSSLTPLEDLINGIDVNSLEERGVPRPAADAKTGVTAGGAVSRKRRAAIAQPGTTRPNKKRSIRPSRKPKDFVEGKQMDPERWLPLRDRSSYRPKGKKKGRLQQAQGATQGGEESPAGGSRPDTPSAAANALVGGAGGSSKSKKKKGKK